MHKISKAREVKRLFEASFNLSKLVLLNSNGWTHKDLFDNLNFNVLTRRAFGLYGLSEKLFSEGTFYKFQRRLLEHWLRTGVNLLELSFQKLTSKMIELLGLKTDIKQCLMMINARLVH